MRPWRAIVLLLKGWLTLEGIGALLSLVLMGSACALLIAWKVSHDRILSFGVFGVAMVGLAYLARLAAPAVISVWPPKGAPK